MEKNTNCIICHDIRLKEISSTHKLDNFNDMFVLEECQNCNHVTIKNKPSEERLNKYYERDFWEEKIRDFDFNLKWNKVLISSSSSHERFIRSKKQFKYITSKLDLNKNTKIIDIGSGFAPILYHFSKANYKKLYALEFSKNLCKYLKIQNINAVNASLEELAKMNMHFDLIIISHTLEHVANPIKFLELIKKISTNGTSLFIEVPFQDYLEPFNENLHLNFFSKVSLLKALESSRFTQHSIEIDKHNLLDKFLLKILFFIYGIFFSKSKKSINSKSNILSILHFLWRPIKKILSSKINIHISRRDIRTIAIFSDKS